MLVKGCWQNSSMGVPGADTLVWHSTSPEYLSRHPSGSVSYHMAGLTIPCRQRCPALPVGAAPRGRHPGKGRSRHRDGGVRKSDSWVSSSFKFHKQSRRSKRISSPQINSPAYIVFLPRRGESSNGHPHRDDKFYFQIVSPHIVRLC